MDLQEIANNFVKCVRKIWNRVKKFFDSILRVFNKNYKKVLLKTSNLKYVYYYKHTKSLRIRNKYFKRMHNEFIHKVKLYKEANNKLETNIL